MPFGFFASCGLLILSADFVLASGGIKIENHHGLKTTMAGEGFRAHWDSLTDTHKLQGKLSDLLTKEQIDLIIMLEVNIAIAADPRFPSLEDELLRFISVGSRFETGQLPDNFDRLRSPRKHLVAIFRTRKGDYGLITLYRELAVIELNGMVGVVPSAVQNVNQPTAGRKQSER